MPRMAGFAKRWRALFSGWREDEELDEELRFHVEEATARNVARGKTSGEARRQALIALGGVEKTKEEWRGAKRPQRRRTRDRRCS